MEFIDSNYNCKPIYAKLDTLNSQLKKQGCVPDTRLVLPDLDEKKMKYILCCKNLQKEKEKTHQNCYNLTLLISTCK